MTRFQDYRLEFETIEFIFFFVSQEYCLIDNDRDYLVDDDLISEINISNE